MDFIYKAFSTGDILRSLVLFYFMPCIAVMAFFMESKIVWWIVSVFMILLTINGIIIAFKMIKYFVSDFSSKKAAH